MQIIFDMQTALVGVESVDGFDYIAPVGVPAPLFSLEHTEDIKTIRIHNRAHPKAGMRIKLSAIPELKTGDRITVTGRIGGGAPFGSWGIALTTEDGASETNQLVQMISPRTLFSLSHIVEDINHDISLQTTKWVTLDPVMDIMVDSIFIFRETKDMDIQADTREIVYSMAEDPDIQWVDNREARKFEETDILRASGSPIIKLVKKDDRVVIHAENRYNDYDGIDVSLKNMVFLPGNRYTITIIGCVDGKVPKLIADGAHIMIQGLPDFSWRCLEALEDDKEFTMTHTLTPSEMGKWRAFRITTDKAAAMVAFYIYSIEIKRVG